MSSIVEQFIYFALAIDYDARLHKQLGGDAVAIGQATREATVIYLTLATGGATLLEQGQSTVIYSCQLEGGQGSAPKVICHIPTISHHNSLAHSLAGCSGCGEAAVYLGADGYEIIFLGEGGDVYLAHALAIIATADAQKAGTDKQIFLHFYYPFSYLIQHGVAICR